MNKTNSASGARRYLFVLALILLLAPHSASLTAQPLDFGELGEPNQSVTTTKQLLATRSTLWEGNVRDLTFEATYTSGHLVWATASSSHLHVSTGQNVGIYPGDVQRRIPGRILFLDVNRMPHLDNRILISVTYFGPNQLVSELFEFNARTHELRSFHREPMAAIRPLSKFLFGQSFDSNLGWATDIFRLETTKNGYNWKRELRVPAGARLLQMEQLPGNYFCYLTDDGSFVVSRGVRIQRTFDGNYGATTRQYGQFSPREMNQPRSIRIPPQYIPEHQLIAVAKNPSTKAGLQGLITAGTQSSITLFQWRDNGIVNDLTLGPLEGRILDVEITRANPNQLLWLRKSTERTVLEMIDLREQTTFQN